PRLVLTESGVSYFRDISQILDNLQEVSIDVVRGRKASTSLLVGTHPTFASRWLAPRLRSFIAANPDIPLEITQTSPDVDFSTSRVDIFVLRGIGSWIGARSYELYREKLAVVASPRMIALGAKLDQTEFSNYPLLQNANRPSMWLHWLRLIGINYRGTITGPRFSHSGMMINAAVAGLGLAIVPVRYIELELARGDLHMPFGEPIPSGESNFIVYPERKSHRKNLIVFRDWLMRETRSYRVGAASSESFQDL
ncbi:MAG: LysR substrate-binding domain-containing protein, partial [Phyllobacterium sp.]